MQFQNYFFLSAVDWKGYLQAMAVSDTVELAVSNQTRQLVASNKALAQRYGEGFNQIAGTLDMGFGRLERSLDMGFGRLERSLAGVEASIEGLRSDFNYHVTLLLDELQIQRGILIGIADRLDAIYGVLITPLRTRSRELFKEGCALMAKGLLDKALEFLCRANQEYDVDFFTHFQVGKLYLYGVNRENNVINLKRAEEHLRLATRYGKPEVKQLPEMAKLTAEALLHLSIACYAQAAELKKTGPEQAAREKVKEAYNFAREAADLNPRLSEAHYHLAKYSAVLGDTEQALVNLEKALVWDLTYLLKVEADPDFNKVKPEIQIFFERLQEAPLTSQQKRANEIMGQNFFGIKEAIQYYGVFPTSDMLTALADIPFSEATLRACKSTHILVANFGLSIADIQKKVANKGKLFGLTISLDPKFFEKTGQTGWTLVRKTPVDNSTNMTWIEQQALISRNEYVPLAQLMVYTIIGYYLATSDRLFERIFVRCSDSPPHGSRVYIGYFFKPHGLHVDDHWGNGAPHVNDLLAVASARKPDV